MLAEQAALPLLFPYLESSSAQLTYQLTKPIVSPMRALFLADAHLCKPADPNYRALLSFLDEQRGKTDVLVLLGDIFEFWIGKDTVIDDHLPMIESLERMYQQGTRLVYVEGNHDFHLGPVFEQRLDCRVLPDGGTIEVDDKKVFVAHGDLVNPNDTGYRCLRKFLRSNAIRQLIRILPNRWLMSIAARASHESRKSSRGKRSLRPVRDILVPYAEEFFATGHQVVITGHHHQPMHEKLGDGELIALGDWITQFSYAVYEDNAFALKNYSAASASPEPAS
jgi:UDP-2,3-diacylglucosamine hydrolase